MKIETQQYDENRLEGQKVLVSFWERKHSSLKKKTKNTMKINIRQFENLII